MHRLESELGEEPCVLACAVSFLELLLDLSSCFLLCGGVLDARLDDDGFVDRDVDGVTGRHKVVVVDDLDESLDLTSLCDGLL